MADPYKNVVYVLFSKKKIGNKLQQKWMRELWSELTLEKRPKRNRVTNMIRAYNNWKKEN